MPYKYVPPECVLQAKGVAIYRAYKSENFNDPLEGWYTTDINEDPEYEFNIKTLPCYAKSLTHNEVLQKAIVEGHLSAPKV